MTPKSKSPPRLPVVRLNRGFDHWPLLSARPHLGLWKARQSFCLHSSPLSSLEALTGILPERSPVLVTLALAPLRPRKDKFYREIGVSRKITIWGQEGIYIESYGRNRKYRGRCYTLDGGAALGVTSIEVADGPWDSAEYVETFQLFKVAEAGDAADVQSIYRHFLYEPM